MIHSKAYDVEILPNFFSITIVDLNDYLKVFADCHDGGKKKNPVPLTDKYTTVEIKQKLSNIRKWKFYITDTDDSQLLPMLSFINNMSPYVNEQGVSYRTDMFSYNGSRYDKLMVAALLMHYAQCKTTKELISVLYETSRYIIDIQNDKERARSDYRLSNLYGYSLPFIDVDTMQVFALNKCGKGVDKATGETVYYPKSLKQTSINLKWYELLEYEMPKITEKDAHYYKDIPHLMGIEPDVLNKFVDTWDRYIHPDWIPDMMWYNENDVFIVCEMVRLYIDEIRLRYNIERVYKVKVLSSSRSNIADKLFEKFYSEFSGLAPHQWKGKRTERTGMSFKRVIFPVIEFKTPALQQMLEEMRKVVVHSVSKDSFVKEVKINNLTYTIATGGLHSQDVPRELKSKMKTISGSYVNDKGDLVWDNLTDDSYVYVHYDIASFYPSIMAIYKVAPEHLNAGVFCKLIKWLTDMRVEAKHSSEDNIEGVPKDVFVQVLKIVINALYGKLGYQYGDLLDKLAVLKTTINGQLLIMMLCEDLELNGIELVSANTDGIVVKLYKTHKHIFDRITKEWEEKTKFKADSEEYQAYVNRDINNYAIKEINGKMTYKGSLNPKMYAVDLQKGYNMPIVAKAVCEYFFNNKPVMETLYDCTDILEFCKTQNIGRKYHVELVIGAETEVLQRNVRYYVCKDGGTLFKVFNHGDANDVRRDNLCAGQKVKVLNSLNDDKIFLRNIDYVYYYEEAMKIINPIKLGISASRKGNKEKGTASGKVLLKKYAGQYNTLFDGFEE